MLKSEQEADDAVDDVAGEELDTLEVADEELDTLKVADEELDTPDVAGEELDSLEIVSDEDAAFAPTNAELEAPTELEVPEA